MLHTLKLLLPVLVPSWRFFDFIEASPRVEYLVLGGGDGHSEQWQEFRPRPRHISPAEMIGRLFYNPVWNEHLFLMSCAERLVRSPDQHSQQQILDAIQCHLIQHHPNLPASAQLQFRLVFLSRRAQKMSRETRYTSPITAIKQAKDDAV